jgi:branched-chain amino acid transport system ATP-binding protein
MSPARPPEGARTAARQGEGSNVLPALEVDGLCAGYGAVNVLHEVSLRVMPGQLVTVIGPNGAGKSTLLNTLAGLMNAQRGRIRLAGDDVADLDTEDRVARGLGLVTEKRDLFGSMTVRDNLWLGTFQRRRTPKAALAALDDVYELFPRLHERRQQTAHTLSGGERQMLALGRAFLAGPKLLMLDEPSLGLAPLIVRDTLQTVARLRDRGLAVLLVEQNARAALRIADHGYVLENGRITLQGPAAELLNDPAVTASYLGGVSQVADAVLS